MQSLSELLSRFRNEFDDGNWFGISNQSRTAELGLNNLLSVLRTSIWADENKSIWPFLPRISENISLPYSHSYTNRITRFRRCSCIKEKTDRYGLIYDWTSCTADPLSSRSIGNLDGLFISHFSNDLRPRQSSCQNDSARAIQTVQGEGNNW
jgi:hypothetical protein